MKTNPNTEITDWDKELEDIRSLYEPAPKLPPKPAATTPGKPKKRRPMYHGTPQYDQVMEDKEAFFSRHRGAVIIILFLLIFALLIGVLLFAVSKLTLSGSSEDTILKNVHIAGVDVGGMTREEAQQAVEARFAQWEMSVTVNGTQILLPPQVSSAQLDAAAVVDRALLFGREGGKLQQIEAYANALSESQTIGLLPYLTLDRDAIRGELNRLDDSFRQSSHSLSGSLPSLDAQSFDPSVPLPSLVLDLGCPGGAVDKDALMEQILGAYDEGKQKLEITSAVAEQHPQALDLDAVYAAVSVAPSKDSYGIDFDLENARAIVAAAKPGDMLRIPLRYVQPLSANVTTDFPDVLSACETIHNDDSRRNANMELVCQMLNGTVITPGEIFSFNAAIGERTMERGFLSASAYSNYSYAQPIAGGIIQNASSLYLCAMLADLEIVERESAQFKPGFVNPGMDAEVGWPGPDLKFRNNTDYPIQIFCQLEEEHLVTQLLGTETKDYYVAMEYEISNFESPIVYQDVAPGTYQNGTVISYGVSGAYVQTFRCKYSRQTGECISRLPEDTSNYPTSQTVVARVTAPPEA